MCWAIFNPRACPLGTTEWRRHYGPFQIQTRPPPVIVLRICLCLQSGCIGKTCVQTVRSFVLCVCLNEPHMFRRGSKVFIYGSMAGLHACVLFRFLLDGAPCDVRKLGPRRRRRRQRRKSCWIGMLRSRIFRSVVYVCTPRPPARQFF